MVSPCRTFGVSETCYRYSPLLSDETEYIADLWADHCPGRALKMPEKGRTEDLGVWAMFPASVQCAGPSLDPQTGLSLPPSRAFSMHCWGSGIVPL
jgi:hypothetical protein